MNNSDPILEPDRWVEVRQREDGCWYWDVLTERGERSPHVLPYLTQQDALVSAWGAAPSLPVRVAN